MKEGDGMRGNDREPGASRARRVLIPSSASAAVMILRLIIVAYSLHRRGRSRFTLR